MASGSVLVFVGLVVGACIVGGAVYAGLSKIADAIRRDGTTER